MIEAYALKYPFGDLALYRDRAAAERQLPMVSATVTLHKLVDEAAILRKFDGYVPADQVSSLRFRILELEGQAERLQRALDFISTAETGGELFPVGPSDTRYADDGNTVIEHLGPWLFLNGQGATFLNAVECAMQRRTQQMPPLSDLLQGDWFSGEALRAAVNQKPFEPAVAGPEFAAAIGIQPAKASGPTDAELLKAAEPFFAYPDGKDPTLRGAADIVAFARAVLAGDPVYAEPPKGYTTKRATWTGCVNHTCDTCGFETRSEHSIVAHVRDHARPPLCSCFPGTCRGGEVIDGKTATGHVCQVGAQAVKDAARHSACVDARNGCSEAITCPPGKCCRIVTDPAKIAEAFERDDDAR